MSAKIKSHRSRYKHYRPKGTKQHHFEKVYWPYLPIMLAISGLVWFGTSNGNFAYAVEYGLQDNAFDPQIAVLPFTSTVAAVAIWAVLIIALCALGIKHLKQIKRGLKKGEKYVMHHPAIDIGLIVVIALAYLISQTSVYTF